MAGLFEDARDFNEDIVSWDVGAATNMERTFKSCKAFTQNITGWKVEKVEKWEGCFEGTTKLDMKGFLMPTGLTGTGTKGKRISMRI